jgi:Domain of unknown function (DUF5666)
MDEADQVGTGSDPTDVGPPDPSPFRRHPVRWSVAAGGLAAVLALGGYGVTHAATSTATSSTASPGAGIGGPPGLSGPTGQGAPGSGGGTASQEAPPPAGEGVGRGTGSGPGGPGSHGGTVGKVSAVVGDTITLTTRANKTIKVIVTSTTVYKNGSTIVTASALKSGVVAVVRGSTSSDGTVTATAITLGTAPIGAP